MQGNICDAERLTPVLAFNSPGEYGSKIIAGDVSMADGEPVDKLPPNPGYYLIRKLPQRIRAVAPPGSPSQPWLVQGHRSPP